MNWQIPNTEMITLGGIKIVWLDKSQAISRSELQANLIAAETEKAETIKAETRKTEFERSRYLLRKVTGWTQAFLPDDQNVPVWPEFHCGSISHKNGHVAITCALKTDRASLGIDCEHSEKDISHLKEKICNAEELTLLARLAAQEKAKLGSLVALVFSAKEAVFKCHHPLGRIMFWFHDAQVEFIDFSAGRIDIKVIVTTSDRTLAGHKTTVYFTEKTASDGQYWLAACSE